MKGNNFKLDMPSSLRKERGDRQRPVFPRQFPKQKKPTDSVGNTQHPSDNPVQSRRDP